MYNKGCLRERIIHSGEGKIKTMTMTEKEEKIERPLDSHGWLSGCRGTPAVCSGLLREIGVGPGL